MTTYTPKSRQVGAARCMVRGQGWGDLSLMTMNEALLSSLSCMSMKLKLRDVHEQTSIIYAHIFHYRSHLEQPPRGLITGPCGHPPVITITTIMLSLPEKSITIKRPGG